MVGLRGMCSPWVSYDAIESAGLRGRVYTHSEMSARHDHAHLQGPITLCAVAAGTNSDHFVNRRTPVPQNKQALSNHVNLARIPDAAL
jgi:hypothetical protein